MKRLFSIFIIGFIFSACGQNPIGKPAFVMYSENVKDSFDIYINLPKSYSPIKTYNAFYYLDANIKSGNKIREIVRDSLLNPKFSNTIFVGIGHKGDFHVLRRRDFTVPEIIGKDTFGLSNNFGQIDRFYLFMKYELIPYLNNNYNINNSENSLLGHSFGGLFTIYALFKNDSIFKHYFALSPSLWVSNYSIYNFNKLDTNFDVNKNLLVAAGSLELLNKIKSGADQFELYLKNMKYKSLQFEYKIYKGETHNSEVPHSISDILCDR